MLTPATSAMRVVVAASSPSRSRIWTVASRIARTVSCARACCGCFRTRTAIASTALLGGEAPVDANVTGRAAEGGRAQENAAFEGVEVLVSHDLVRNDLRHVDHDRTCLLGAIIRAGR